MPRPTLLLLVTALAALPALPPDAGAAKRNPPVILFVFDEFPTDALVGRNGNIDRVRFPNFARLAARSTWFRNATTVNDTTPESVPSIVDGRMPSAGPDRPSNAFSLLRRHGYLVYADETSTAMCPPVTCRRTSVQPTEFREQLARRARRFRQAVRGIARRRRPAFHFHHALFPHVPWAYLPSGRTYRSDPSLFTGTASSRAFHDVFVTEQNQQRQLLQVGFADRLIGALLDRLERVRVLDRAVVIVTADHGYGFDRGVDDRRVATAKSIDEVAPVPLFVKAPGQRRGRVSGAYARTVDVLPTIARFARIPVGWRHAGRSLYSRPVRRRRRVIVQKRDFSGVIAISARSFERRRARNQRSRRRLFGTGPWDAVYRIGPNKGLLGRAAGSLPSASPNGTSASFATTTHTYDPRRRLAPVWTSGLIAGGERGARRDVAAAVNGRISAVGRTYSLRGDRRERFSLIVPERSLRSGGNRLDLYEVVRTPAGRALRPLGGT